VVASNIEWSWTPNKLLAGMIGGVTAYGVTAALSKVGDLLMVWRARRAKAARVTHLPLTG
jgi:hypothetical protein